MQAHRRPTRCDTAGGGDGGALIPAGGQPGGFAGGVDAAQLRRDGDDAGQAHRQHHDQGGNAQGGLDRAGTGIAGYTAVLSARPMIRVRAATTESPVTTAYRIAPKAAAAMVPMAYSTVDMPASSTVSDITRILSDRII